MTTPPPKRRSLRGEELRAKIRQDPEWFFRRVLGQDPWDKQVEIARAIFRSRRVAVRGCVASSKTNAISMACLAWLYSWVDARVFTFAPSYRQVGTNLWAEIKQKITAATNNGVPLGGKLFAGTQFSLNDNWYMKGFSTKEPEMLHGIHGPHDLVVLDDAHGIPRALTDELENMMAGGDTHLVMSFNPVVVEGETYDCNHSMRDLWENIQIAYSDTPNAGHLRKIPGMLLPETVEMWKRKYGEESNFFRTKVLAEYPTQEADTLIPMNWIELAMAREVPQDDPLVTVGCDVAWEGDDDTIIAEMRGRQVKELEEYHGQDPMVVADKLDVHLVRPDTHAYVDAIGIGAGVYSREAQRKRRVTAVIVSEKAVGLWEGKPAEEHFYNLRAQVAWMLREALDPSNPEAIALPKDQDMVAQIAGIRYKTDETSGRIKLQLKKDMKKDIGYSPDKFDAIALANWGRHLLKMTQLVSAWAAEATVGSLPRSDDSTDGPLGGDLDIGESETLAGLGAFRE